MSCYFLPKCLVYHLYTTPINVSPAANTILDASGRQVVFNGTVKSEHDLSMQVVSVGGAETYIVYDNDTKMCYIGIKDTKNKELVDMLNSFSLKPLLKPMK